MMSSCTPCLPLGHGVGVFSLPRACRVAVCSHEKGVQRAGCSLHCPVCPTGLVIEDCRLLSLGEGYPALSEDRERPLVVSTAERVPRLRGLAEVVGEGTEDERLLRKTSDIMLLHKGIYLYRVLCHPTLAYEVVAVAVDGEVVRRLDESEKGVHPGTLDAAQQRKDL